MPRRHAETSEADFADWLKSRANEQDHLTMDQIFRRLEAYQAGVTIAKKAVEQYGKDLDRIR